MFPSLGNALPRLRRFHGRTHDRRIYRAWPAPSFLGPRLGRKFKRDGGAPMLPHDLTIAVSGGLILWFGWYGFNPGSTLSAMDFVGIGRVATNTTLAACAAGLTSILYGYMMTKKWDAGYTTNGFLAGLVAITCPCYWVSPTGAVLLGGIAGVTRYSGSRPAGMAANRRSHWRGSRSRHLRYLGNTLTRAVCLREIRCNRADRSGQQRSAQGPLLWWRHAGAGGTGHRQCVRHAGDVRGGNGRDASVNATECFACRKRRSSTAWTCTSTAFRLIPSMCCRPWALRVACRKR